MTTAAKKMRSRRRTTSLLRLPNRNPASGATQLSDFGWVGGVPYGLSRSQTIGGTSSRSGLTLEKSLSRSRLKSELCGRRSKKQTVDWLGQPIESYQQLFEYLVPA